ncbi:hypothetical protein [Caulobacter flavus]|uniref:hypothetical protein n=1 Tax=Caulobacter flavus TaxID=1679497 RepID=UPI0013DE0A59|nr:hypothetical protein [Caulobacter flavus]
MTLHDFVVRYFELFILAYLVIATIVIIRKHQRRWRREAEARKGETSCPPVQPDDPARR